MALVRSLSLFWLCCAGPTRALFAFAGQFTESLNNEITFRNIRCVIKRARYSCNLTRTRSSVILEKVCQYLHYRHKYSQPTQTERDIPEFVIEPELALELLMTANFLDV